MFINRIISTSNANPFLLKKNVEYFQITVIIIVIHNNIHAFSLCKSILIQISKI